VSGDERGTVFASSKLVNRKHGDGRRGQGEVYELAKSDSSSNCAGGAAPIDGMRLGRCGFVDFDGNSLGVVALVAQGRSSANINEIVVY
jgi:hypothetical protein